MFHEPLWRDLKNCPEAIDSANARFAVKMAVQIRSHPAIGTISVIVVAVLERIDNLESVLRRQLINDATPISL